MVDQLTPSGFRSWVVAQIHIFNGNPPEASTLMIIADRFEIDPLRGIIIPFTMSPGKTPGEKAQWQATTPLPRDGGQFNDYIVA